MTNLTQNTAPTLTSVIDEMIANRIKWQEGTYAASNAELYALLGDCLDLFNKAKDAKTGLAKAITEQLEERGIAYNSSTSLALKIVRLVFCAPGMEEKIVHRAFTYAKVLKIASEAGQTGDTLSKYITDNHGIDEIRRANKDGLTEAQKSKLNQDYAETVLSDSVSLVDIDLVDALQPNDGEQFSLALIRRNADGTGSIVFGTPNVAAIKTVLALAGGELKDVAKQEDEASVAERSEQMRAINTQRLSQELAAKQGFAPSITVSAVEAVPAE